MTVRTASGDVTLETRVATTEGEAAEGTVEMRFEEPGVLTRVHAVATPSMVYVLLVLGLAALAFELTQPGFGFAGQRDRTRRARRLRSHRRDAVVAVARRVARRDRAADARRAAAQPLVAHVDRARRVRRRIRPGRGVTSTRRSGSARG